MAFSDQVKKRKDYIHHKPKKEATLKAVLADNCETIKLFFKNNDYLRKKAGYSLYGQIKAIYERYGIIITDANIWQYKHGKTHLNLTFLTFFAMFWGEHVGTMLAVDYEERDKVNERLRVERSIGVSAALEY
jgi:hypothetical protein